MRSLPAFLPPHSALGRTWATIAGVAIAFVAFLLHLEDVMAGNTFNGPVYLADFG